MSRVKALPMNEALKKLRVKFIAIIMVVVALILTAVFATIVVLNYHNSVNEVYRALGETLKHAEITQNDTPLGKNPPAIEEPPNESMPHVEIGGPAPERSLVPVAVYEITTNGSLALISDAASGTIAESAFDEAAGEAIGLPDGRGVIDSLGVYYLKETRGKAALIAFADERSAAEWKDLAWLLAGVEAGDLVLFFVVSLFFSRWALKPVETSWRQQQRFIADASHELKTPLTVIAADVAILKRNPDKTITEQSPWIESIEAEGAQMQGLVGDMLLLASADAQGARALESKGMVDLSKIINGEALQFEPIAYERNVAFSNTVESDVAIQGEREKIARLISVLVDNAFKYVDDEGAVAITLATKEGSAVFSVSNTGAAIPAEDIPHIFDRFYRGDRSRTYSEEHSYGLGLSIAYEIVRAHNGTIEVASTAATTVFTVTLPLAN